LVSVCVVGGGIAGIAAAKEAARRGARVTLVERRTELPPVNGSVALLLSGERGARPSRFADPLPRLGVELRLNTRVTSVEEDGRVRTERGAASFDSVVLATGARPVTDRIPGGARSGIHTLMDDNSYSDLGSALQGYTEVAVSGSGPAMLEVADVLKAKGIGVRIFPTAGVVWAKLSDRLRGYLDVRISARGVSVEAARLERVAGVDHVEAVLAGGTVYPCQALVVVPRPLPNAPEARADTGRLGGLAVNGEMRTSRDRVFAAGACAEVAVGQSTVYYDSESAALTTGAAAGANASGSRVSPRISGCLRAAAFGAEVVISGLSLKEALNAGVRAEEVATPGDSGIACALIYRSGSLELLGAQLIGPGAGAYEQVASRMVSESLPIDELAFLELPRTLDVAPILRAADGVNGRRT